MRNIKYAAIIVIYNKTIENSITCKKIENISGYNIEIVIVDNSEIDYKNREICRQKGYTYISMNGNKGLSKAYNAAIDSVLADIVILLDDDTELSLDYFQILNEAVENNENVDIFAPIVYGQDGIIYSPNEFNFLKNNLITDKKQDISQNRFNAIASCLAIRMKVFDSYRFNELLFVDQVDQFFFCEQRKIGRKFMKLDVEINQNFYQRGQKLTPDSGWRRIRLRIMDVMRHARLMGDIRYIPLGYIKCCGLSVQIGKKCNSLKVIVKGLLLSTKCLFFINGKSEDYYERTKH